MKKFKVSTVVRLNAPHYEPERFKRTGINHVDIYFQDGSCPNEVKIQQFIKLCEDEEGAIAVHCKAGLGRTGTMIGNFKTEKNLKKSKNFQNLKK